MMWSFLLIFVVFTLILGAALLFMQSAVQNESQIQSATPTQALTHQASMLVIVFLFIAGGMIFLIGAAKAVVNR